MEQKDTNIEDEQDGMPSSQGHTNFDYTQYPLGAGNQV